MDNKAVYVSSYEERENGSFYEEGYEGMSSRNLSKLNLCEESKGITCDLHLSPDCPSVHCLVKTSHPAVYLDDVPGAGSQAA